MSHQFVSTVRDLSHKGLGVVDHPDGRVFFVRGVWPGDVGEFEVSKEAPKYTEAKIIKLIEHSANRVEVACPHRGSAPGKCGGCPWMMASYSSQLEFKVKRLLHALDKRRIDVRDIIHPIIPSQKVFEYRNRAQFKTDGTAIGYVSEGSNVFAPVEDCLILNPPLRRLFHDLKTTLPRDDFRPTGGHSWCYIDVDDECVGNQIIINRRRPFRQGNTDQNLVMRRWVKEKLSSLPKHYPLVDLFCGSGNFTEVMSEEGFENILAVEVQGVALEILKLRKLQGVRVLELDVQAKGSWAKIAKLQPHAKAILIDPPREGIEKRRGLFKYMDNLEKIFYISCELDTFARDAQDLTANGWKFDELIPLDLFPHTPHVEILATFTKSSKK